MKIINETNTKGLSNSQKRLKAVTESELQRQIYSFNITWIYLTSTERDESRDVHVTMIVTLGRQTTALELIWLSTKDAYLA